MKNYHSISEYKTMVDLVSYLDSFSNDELETKEKIFLKKSERMPTESEIVTSDGLDVPVNELREEQVRLNKKFKELHEIEYENGSRQRPNPEDYSLGNMIKNLKSYLAKGTVHYAEAIEKISRHPSNLEESLENLEVFLLSELVEMDGRCLQDWIYLKDFAHYLKGVEGKENIL